MNENPKQSEKSVKAEFSALKTEFSALNVWWKLFYIFISVAMIWFFVFCMFSLVS